VATTSLKQRTRFFGSGMPGARARVYGFTLIELMMVVAVIAILITIAFPSYEEYRQRARRAVAQGALQAFAIALERFKTEQLAPTYIGATTASSGAGPGSPSSAVFASESPFDGDNKFYDLTVQSAAVSAYELRAAPKNLQSGDKCGTYTLKASGEKGVIDAAAGVVSADCWK
jgi:type IV pilus assembly protein PilE